MSEREKRQNECLKMLKDHVQYTEEQSYNILMKYKHADNLDEVYDIIYDINQRAHTIKKTIDTYQL